MGTMSMGTPGPGPFAKEQDRVAGGRGGGRCWGPPSAGIPSAGQCRVLGTAVSPNSEGVAAPLPGQGRRELVVGTIPGGMERDGEEEKRWGAGGMRQGWTGLGRLDFYFFFLMIVNSTYYIIQYI